MSVSSQLITSIDQTADVVTLMRPSGVPYSMTVTELREQLSAGALFTVRSADRETRFDVVIDAGQLTCVDQRGMPAPAAMAALTV